MAALPVGGVSVTIIVTEIADSGMYFDTSTLIGAGSTGASGGTSACATCTKAGGGCISIVWLPVTLAVYQVLSWRGAGKSIFQGVFTAANRRRLESRPYRNKSVKAVKKGDSSPSSPSSPIRQRSEVERHAFGRSFDGCAPDGVVGSIARADLVAMATRKKTIMRAGALFEQG